MTTIATPTQAQVKHLEETISAVGATMQDTLEQWRKSTEEERAAIEQRLQGFEAVTNELKEMVKERRRTSLPGSEPTGNHKSDFSLSRACNAIRTKDWSRAGVEREIFDAMRAKAMSSGVDADGGFVVPEEAVPQLIEKLYAEMITRQLGTRDFPATGSPITIPRIASSATGYWISGENTEITSSDMGLEQLSMTPKSAAARVIMSNQLLELSSPGADRLIQDDIVRVLSILIDKAVIEGTGASGQPLGIINDPDILTEAISANITYVELTGFPDALVRANALRGKLGWAFHPAMLQQINNIKSENASAGTPSLEVSRKDITQGLPSQILGYPYRTTTSFTALTDANSLVFGNWDDVIVAQWGGLRLMASDVANDAFSYDQTHIRAIMRVDVGLRHPESFVVAT